ncbi:hypothetical protein [Granulosicoccus antarcticus]|uniref:Uncharacterized protein n=1 Tax=Granulosicoccus antarcticus IMCC3135 TaxID=1192854 RepID=A0A2Z2P069_9GAMM|nr:hypothetical protein [Granulosicoccus antarcticus]ASJ73527.1 hypothetical protein IMCC3135_17225 [Granulosicoccus antarcticus IMCC3135]
MQLPDNPFLTEERLEVRVPKTPYLRRQASKERGQNHLRVADP